MAPSLAAVAGAGGPLFPAHWRYCRRGMAPSPTPKRDHGDPQSFRLRSGGKRCWCGRRDLNPHGPCGPTDFRTRLRLSPPLLPWLQGLGSGLSLHRVPDVVPVARCCPSSLYTFPFRGLARDRHVTGFPDFEQFCTAGFPAGTQVLSLKSDASADSATPARFQR